MHWFLDGTSKGSSLDIKPSDQILQIKRLISWLDQQPNQALTGHFHLVQRTSRPCLTQVLLHLFLCVQRVICIWVFFAKKLVHWKSKGVLLGIGIRRIAHEKAPCFKAYCWRKNVKRVLPTKDDYTAYKNTWQAKKWHESQFFIEIFRGKFWFMNIMLWTQKSLSLRFGPLGSRVRNI